MHKTIAFMVLLTTSVVGCDRTPKVQYDVASDVIPDKTVEMPDFQVDSIPEQEQQVKNLTLKSGENVLCSGVALQDALKQKTRCIVSVSIERTKNGRTLSYATNSMYVPFHETATSPYALLIKVPPEKGIFDFMVRTSSEGETAIKLKGKVKIR